MSAMDKLLFSQLQKMLPEDSKHYASPEGIKALGDKLGTFVDFFRRGIMISVQQNDAILKNQRVIMEAMGCDDRYVSGPILNNGSDQHSRRDASSNGGGNPIAA